VRKKVPFFPIFPIKHQEEAVEFFSLLMKLLKEGIWDDALKAVLREEPDKFKDVCNEAEIPDDYPILGAQLHFRFYMMLRAMLEYQPR